MINSAVDALAESEASNRLLYERIDEVTHEVEQINSALITERSKIHSFEHEI
jgi:hypothetical protein